MKKLRDFFFGRRRRLTEEETQQARETLQRFRDEARSSVLGGESCCLSDDQLKAFSNRSFPKGVSREEVSQHLVGCQRCSSRLEELRRAADWRPDKPVNL